MFFLHGLEASQNSSHTGPNLPLADTLYRYKDNVATMRPKTPEMALVTYTVYT